jgi:hypothetical protein
MSEKEYPVTKGSTVKKPVTESTAEILRLAGEDPDKWFDNFTSGRSFLGQNIRDPIHIELAKHLKTVEKELADRFGDGDPAEAGRRLQVDEQIIGARDRPTSASISMHMFGLAIDVNYTANPFVSASANDIFGRAGEGADRARPERPGQARQAGQEVEGGRPRRRRRALEPRPREAAQDDQAGRHDEPAARARPRAPARLGCPLRRQHALRHAHRRRCRREGLRRDPQVPGLGEVAPTSARRA